VKDVPPISLAPPDVAHNAQVFYATRSQQFPSYYTEQTEYFRLNEGSARRSYLASHPDLKQYWDWRRNFLERNPDTVPYLTDGTNPPTYPSPQAYEQAVSNQPNFTPVEWKSYLGDTLFRLVTDGQPLPEIAQQKLDELGVARDDVLHSLIVGSSPAPVGAVP